MASDMGDEVYQPDEAEVQDDAGVLEPEDTLVDRGVPEALDEGYSPPEKPLGVESYGTTAAEQREGEPLEERLSRETADTGDPRPDPDGPGEGDGTAADGVDRVDENTIDDEAVHEATDVDGMTVRDEPTDEEILDAEVAGERAGRLVAPDEGAHADEEKDVVAADVGIDGAAASAEEAAVHLVPEPEEPGDDGAR